MKTVNRRISQAIALAMGLILGGPVLAAGYNVIFKNNAANPVILPCATGGFTFDKTGLPDGNHLPVSPSMTIGANCLSTGHPALTFTNIGTFRVAVLTTAPADPAVAPTYGPNVEGLRNAMTTSAGGVTYALTFKLEGTSQPFTRAYQLISNPGSPMETVIAQGRYHVLNDAAPIPEPSTLALLSAGLAVLGAAVVRKARRKY